MAQVDCTGMVQRKVSWLDRCDRGERIPCYVGQSKCLTKEENDDLNLWEETFFSSRETEHGQAFW